MVQHSESPAESTGFTGGATSGYRWVVWGVLILAYLVVFFHRLALGVVRDDLTLAFGINATTFSNLGATYFYAYTLMQIPSGILADSLGARKTVTYGTLMAACGSLLFGLSPSIGWAFAGRLLVGIGVSVVLIAILKILSQWFPEDQFATMSGLTAFMGNVGGMLAQTPLALMVVWFTWRSTFAGIGIASLFIALLCYVLVRNTPQEMGLPAVGISSSTAHSRPISREALSRGLAAAMKNPGTWPGFFVFMGMFGTYVAMTGAWGNSYLREVFGFSATKASNHLMLAILGHALGCIFIGKLSDQMKRRRRPMALFTLIHVISWALLLFWKGGTVPVWLLPPLLFMLGFSSSAVILSWSCSKEVNDPAIAGIATSIVNMGGFVGAAFLPVILGSIIDRYGHLLEAADLYHRAFLFCLAFAVLSLVGSLLVKETHCRNIYHQIHTSAQSGASTDLKP
ncbi:MFS transporter [Anoxynatronum sibiricum]|uniref:MFS transporter n=1 Tax=Anoxynatronum sibiricum TaxID=210623 RepID=A0ABU9VWI4_9CLOT